MRDGTIVSAADHGAQQWCDHVGGLGPQFPFCPICAAKSADHGATPESNAAKIGWGQIGNPEDISTFGVFVPVAVSRKLERERDAALRSEKSVSAAYLRIRQLVNAWNTQDGGTDVFEVTERAVTALVAERDAALAQLADVISRLELATKERTGALAEAIGARARVAELESVLRSIDDMDPAIDSDEGVNEWGEADCFRQAQRKAHAALARGKP
jgi:hypothetical protein